MSNYPNAPGYKEPTTSKEAAREIASHAATVRSAVLQAYLQSPRGLTADEAAEMVGQSILTVRPRVSELKAIGMLLDTGLRRANDTGKRASVLKFSLGQMRFEF